MTTEKTSSPALIAVAWLVVGVPLCWGIYKSGLNAVKLFQPAPATAAAAPAGATPAPTSTATPAPAPAK